MNIPIPKDLPDNEFVKSMANKYRTVMKKGDFKSIVWDRIAKEFVVTR